MKAPRELITTKTEKVVEKMTRGLENLAFTKAATTGENVERKQMSPKKKPGKASRDGRSKIEQKAAAAVTMVKENVACTRSSVLLLIWNKDIKHNDRRPPHSPK